MLFLFELGGSVAENVALMTLRRVFAVGVDLGRIPERPMLLIDSVESSGLQLGPCEVGLQQVVVLSHFKVVVLV